MGGGGGIESPSEPDTPSRRSYISSTDSGESGVIITVISNLVIGIHDTITRDTRSQIQIWTFRPKRRRRRNRGVGGMSVPDHEGLAGEYLVAEEVEGEGGWREPAHHNPIRLSVVGQGRKAMAGG